ncbi:chitinase A-like protein [Compostimonas suwonensis]|uniref:Chitinase A-like protein n=1 Tax=Compostimonas suwonensis TaxID=1048394 RepID=A0A2M9C4V2_9MICO|nr:chitinase A-like protein [Compostimonas suwonensis]
MKRLIRTLVPVCIVALLALPTTAAHAEEPPPPPVNLLAADMDTTFDGGVADFSVFVPTSGATQTIVDVDGDPAVELRDSAQGAAVASYFYKRWSTGALKDRINEVYRQPAGSPAVDFVLQYELARSAASTKPVAKDLYAQLTFGNFDNVNVPRFPVPSTSVTTTAAYTSTSGDLSLVSEADIPSYRFRIVPNGGVRTISTVELGFQVRVDSTGTDEALLIDDIGIYEVPLLVDPNPPTAPTALVSSGVNAGGLTLSWAPATDDVAVAGYDVYRDGYLVASSSAATTFALIGSLMPATSYDFTVRAKDVSGNASPPSAPLRVTTGPYVPESPAPFPGTTETRLGWLWQKTKDMKEESGAINVAAYTAQLADGQNVATNLAKLDTQFQLYDAEQYKSVSKMYSYLMVGDQFSPAMVDHVKGYFADYAYGKLNQTENLRMANYVTGYLVGQYFPDVVDLNGNSGEALQAVTQAPIEEMIDAGVHRGWAEYQSPEYTFMTYFGLNALYQWSDDEALRQKAKMAMDVMWFEWANDWIDGYMISSLSRSKGDQSSTNDPTWRPGDHSAFAWSYFGAHRQQLGVGESDNTAPAAYRPNLEYLGFVTWPGMDYTPPELAVEIGRMTDKDYTSHKTNLQNSSGRAMDIYRTSYVKPTWGLGTEVQYRRVDNWIEDQPLVLRWHSDAANPLFRLSMDQGTASIGSYNQPANHRVMQNGGTAIGVYKSSGDQTTNFINAMFPANGSIVERREVGDWVLADAGSVYFAYQLLKPATWYHQTPNDPANKVKTTSSTHPTASLSYSYDILRSQADRNGWVLETADAADYASLDDFAAAIAGTSVDASHIDETNPRLVYQGLNGDTLDLTFDNAAAAPSGAAKVNDVAIDYDSYKLFDTPWLQQDELGSVFTATVDDRSVVYDFDDWTITASEEPGEPEEPEEPGEPEDDGAAALPASATLSSDNGWDTGLNDGDYTVSMNLWWGENASSFRLFENGQLVGATPLTPGTPAAQHAGILITGRANGSYVYTGELVNSKGVREVGPLTVTVRDANPGSPTLSSDNWDGDGDYTVTANLWWGTNASSYRFLENGQVVAEGTLATASPQAQRAVLPVAGKTAGSYEYTVEFTNPAGTTTSRPLEVTVS